MYKELLTDFFNEEYKIESIKIVDNYDGLSITILIDIETDNYYFDKCKFFNFNNTNKNLYIDISTGGDIFMDCKIWKFNDKWIKYINSKQK